MVVIHRRSLKKQTGAKKTTARKKRLFEKGSRPTLTILGKRKTQKAKSRGGEIKTRLQSVDTANVLDKMPKRVQPDAKSLIHEMYLSPARKDALEAYSEFVNRYKAKHPKAVECLEKDHDVLFAFYDFPAEHWTHLRTTNPIESTFATVRHRTRQTKGCGSRLATLTMVFKLAKEAERKWRRLNGHHLIAKVVEGIQFVDGELKEIAA